VATITIGTHGLVEEDVVWRVAAGADARAIFILYDDEEHTVPTDLTGFTGACEVRAKLGGTLLGTAVMTIGGMDGTVDVHLPAAQSAGWSARQTTAVFDVELTAPDLTVTRLCSGTLDILPNATTGVTA
jgi:hypothetical protein